MTTPWYKTLNIFDVTEIARIRRINQPTVSKRILTDTSIARARDIDMCILVHIKQSELRAGVEGRYLCNNCWGTAPLL